MQTTTYPSAQINFRRADLIVHAIGLALILVAGPVLLHMAIQSNTPAVTLAVLVYVLCALASNLASWAYHFLPLHDRRTLLRRIDHAAIYSSITGTFTPFFVLSDALWPQILLWLCWALTLLAAWHKITSQTVKSRWSTASYLALGALGLTAMPYMTNFPARVLYGVLAGAAFYVIGTAFYARKSMPYRYAIWHSFVNLGAISMFVGVWIAVAYSAATTSL